MLKLKYFLVEIFWNGNIYFYLRKISQRKINLK